MKKVLLATTAITAISLAGVASAQESNMMSAAGNTLNIGGYYEYGFATLSDSIVIDERASDSKTYGESELFIDFETTTDGGLTYGVQIDLEIVNGNSHAEGGEAKNAEESSMYLTDDFGTVHLGHDDNAYGRFLTWAPTFEGSTSQDDNVLSNKRVNERSGDNLKVAHTAAGQGQAYEDNAKITYVSPNFSGFQFGLSTADSDTADNNATAFGLSYKRDVLERWLDDTSIKVTGGSYSNNAGGDAGESHMQVGATFDMGNWTFTAARYDGDTPFNGTNDDATGEVAMESTEFGVGYQISDAFAFGASFAMSTSEIMTGTYNAADHDRTTAAPNTLADDAPLVGANETGTHEGDFQSLSASYDVAPGLKTTLSYNQHSIQSEDFTTNTYNNENDGTEIVWQFEFSF